MENKEDLSIIIPIAGIGKRMKSYGPKALIDLGRGSNILYRQLNLLQYNYPKADIVIVAGFDYDKIAKAINEWAEYRIAGKKNITLINNKDYISTNVAYSIACGIEACETDNILIVYGDLVFNKEAINIDFNKNGILTTDTMGQLEIGVEEKDNKVVRFCYSSKMKWSQIAFLHKQELEIFKRLVDKKEKRKFFTFEILNLMIESNNIELEIYKNINAKVIEVDQANDIEFARKLSQENPVS